jgi:serine/threonine protein phosphatase PrpC
MQELLNAGTIKAEEVAEHPQRSMLTQALMGTGSVSIGLNVFEAKESDRFILCSDGLSGVLDNQKILSLVRSLSPANAVTALVDAAYVQGAPDNVTVIVADILTSQPKDEGFEFFGTAVS